MSKPIEIERKSWNTRRSAKALHAALKAARFERRWLSPHDAASISGIPVHMVRDALPALAGELGGDLRAREDGELEFRFDDLSRRPFRWAMPPRVQWLFNIAKSMIVGTGTLTVGFFASCITALILLALGMILVRVDGVVFVAIGSVVLITSLFFCLPLIMIPIVGMMVELVIKAAHTSTLEVIFALILVAPLGLLYLAGFAVMANFYHSTFKRIAPWVATLANFGESDKGELEDEERFAQLVRANQGRITLGDLIILYGWKRDEAFKQATRLMVDYDGDISVDDDGNITFHFVELARSKGTRKRPLPVWEDEKSPHQNLGTSGRRAGVYALLAWSGFIAATASIGEMLNNVVMFNNFYENLPAWGSMTITVALALFGALPIVILFRSVAIHWRQWRHQRRLATLKTLREIVMHSGRVSRHPNDIPARTVAAFDGTVNVDASFDDDVVFEFPLLAEAASRWS